MKIRGIPYFVTVTDEAPMKLLKWGMGSPQLQSEASFYLPTDFVDPELQTDEKIAIENGVLKFSINHPGQPYARYLGSVAGEDTLRHGPYEVLNLCMVESDKSGLRFQVDQYRLLRVPGEVGRLSLDRSVRPDRNSGFSFELPDVDEFNEVINSICSL